MGVYNGRSSIQSGREGLASVRILDAQEGSHSSAARVNLALRFVTHLREVAIHALKSQVEYVGDMRLWVCL